MARGTAAGERKETPKRRRLSGEQRRASLLEAAVAVFARRGYAAARIDEIASAADVSKALIYEHFASKRELHAAMLEQHVSELVERLGTALAEAEPGEARMRAGTEVFFTFLEERRGAAAIMLRNTGDPDVAAWLARLREQVGAAIVALMSEEMAAEIERDPRLRISIEMLAQQQIGAVQSLADWWGEHRDVPKEDVIAAVMELAWVGLERISQGERWSG